MSINCILIDDEPDALEVLGKLLELYCPGLHVVGSCRTIFEGLKAIGQQRPALVFLDIEMPGGSGLELASEIDPAQTRIIFTTAYPHFSLDAFKVNAFDYLLKPIDPDDLIHTINRYKQVCNKEAGLQEKPGHLFKLNDRDYTLFVEPDQILYIKAMGRYSNIVLHDHRLFMLTRNLGDLEQELPARLFIRPHKSYLVNVSGIDKISHKDGGFLVLKNGVEIEIARRKRVEIIRRLSQPYL